MREARIKMKSCKRILEIDVILICKVKICCTFFTFMLNSPLHSWNMAQLLTPIDQLLHEVGWWRIHRGTCEDSKTKSSYSFNSVFKPQSRLRLKASAHFKVHTFFLIFTVMLPRLFTKCMQYRRYFAQLTAIGIGPPFSIERFLSDFRTMAIADAIFIAVVITQPPHA